MCFCQRTDEQMSWWLMLLLVGCLSKFRMQTREDREDVWLFWEMKHVKRLFC